MKYRVVRPEYDQRIEFEGNLLDYNVAQGGFLTIFKTLPNSTGENERKQLATFAPMEWAFIEEVEE